MAWISAEAIRVAGGGLFESITQRDLVVEYEDVLDRGWVEIDGAILLRARHKSYVGQRS